MALLQVGMICPPPLWMASVCRTTSHTCTKQQLERVQQGCSNKLGLGNSGVTKDLKVQSLIWHQSKGCKAANFQQKLFWYKLDLY